MNHEQLAVMIARALKREPSLEISAGNVEPTLNVFSDKEKISSWAKQDTALLVNCGIIDAANGISFEPQVSATRAEAAVMIARMCR